MDEQPDKEDHETEDTAMWRAATRDIEKLPLTKVPPGLKSTYRRWNVRRGDSDTADFQSATHHEYVSTDPGLDRRTDERLRRGQLPIEARLDLHSMNQGQAQESLRHFVRRASARGLRCVLVITGKGTAVRDDTLWPGDWTAAPAGILRDRLPEWLSEGEIAPLVLRYYPAQRQHGGDGAFYILLRRQRRR